MHIKTANCAVVFESIVGPDIAVMMQDEMTNPEVVALENKLSFRENISVH